MRGQCAEMSHGRQAMDQHVDVEFDNEFWGHQVDQQVINIDHEVHVHNQILIKS